MTHVKTGVRSLLVCLVVLTMPRDAFALWGWIEQMSGPGPFTWAIQVPFDRLACVVKTADGQTTVVHTLVMPRGEGQADGKRDNDAYLACVRDDPDAIKLFVSTELGVAASSRNELFANANDDVHQVRWITARALAFYRATRFLDLGAGIGVNRFSGRDFNRMYRVSIPLQARIVPAGFAKGANPKWRAFYLEVQTDFFPSTFTSADFGAPGNWRSSNEFVGSYFLGVDVLRLVR